MSSGKLHKLILMLSSPHDNEVLAAARAIERQLKTEKKDWHWLADQVGGSNPKPVRDEDDGDEEDEAPRAGPWGSSKPQFYEYATAVALSSDDVAKLTACARRTSLLTGKERSFIQQMYIRHSRFEEKARYTASQVQWIRVIYARIYERLREDTAT